MEFQHNLNQRWVKAHHRLIFLYLKEHPQNPNPNLGSRHLMLQPSSPTSATYTTKLDRHHLDWPTIPPPLCHTRVLRLEEWTKGCRTTVSFVVAGCCETEQRPPCCYRCCHFRREENSGKGIKVGCCRMLLMLSFHRKRSAFCDFFPFSFVHETDDNHLAVADRHRCWVFVYVCCVYM